MLSTSFVRCCVVVVVVVEVGKKTSGAKECKSTQTENDEVACKWEIRCSSREREEKNSIYTGMPTAKCGKASAIPNKIPFQLVLPGMVVWTLVLLGIAFLFLPQLLLVLVHGNARYNINITGKPFRSMSTIGAIQINWHCSEKNVKRNNDQKLELITSI